MNDFISNYRSERHERRPHTRVGKSATATLAESDETTTSIGSALREHWPEYLIEGWALGSFMISVGLFVTIFELPRSLVLAVVPDADLRVALLGIAIGTTAILLIYSAWGKRSGAHMNPAITLAFLRLGKIRTWDAVFFIAAQTLGGTLGVIVAAICLGSVFTDPPVNYAVTVPGWAGAAVAFAAETVISFALMTTILYQRPRRLLIEGDSLGTSFLDSLGAEDLRHAISGEIARGLFGRGASGVGPAIEGGNQSRRLLSLAAVRDGMDRGSAARIGGMDRQTLRDWVHRFNAAGPDSLIDNWTEGPKPRLSAEQLAALATLVEAGPDREKDGVVRWRRVDLKRVIAERFGVDFHERYVGKLLKKLGFSHISARPRHPAQDERIVEAFKKTSRAR